MQFPKSAFTHNSERSRDPRLSRNKEKCSHLLKAKNASPKILTDISSEFLNRITKPSKKLPSPNQSRVSSENKVSSVEIKLTHITVVLDVLQSLLHKPKEPQQEESSLELFDSDLRSAVSEGNTDEVVRLLSWKKSPNIEECCEPKLLIVAARNGFADIVGMLIRHGADVNVRSQSGSTALFAAAYSGHIMTMAVLLQWGATVNIQNTRFETPLLLAIKHGHFSCVLLLLAYGATPIPCITAEKPQLLSPLQSALHLNQNQIQIALITAYTRIDQYLLNLVESSLPKNAFLVEPGHQHRTELLLPPSMSFIPVQIISPSDAYNFNFTFDTPLLYSSSVDQQTQKNSARSQLSTEDSISDELILLYLASVKLVNGDIFCAADVTTPKLSHVELNGVKNRTELSLSCKSKYLSNSPGFQVFVLGSHLRSSVSNSLTLEIGCEGRKHSNGVAYSRNHYYNKWRQSRSSPLDDTIETNLYEPFHKWLVGIYRVRVGPTAFSSTSRRSLSKQSPSRDYSEGRF